MQEQEIHDLVASVLDALKTQQAFPAPSVGQGGRLSAMQSEQRPLTGSGAEPELLAATVDADTGASLEDLGEFCFRKPQVKEPHNPDVAGVHAEYRAWIGGGVWNASRPRLTCVFWRITPDPRERFSVKFLRNGCAGAGCWRFARWCGRQGYLSDASGFGARTLGGVPNGAGALQARPAGCRSCCPTGFEHRMPCFANADEIVPADQRPEAGRVHGGRSAVPGVTAGRALRTVWVRPGQTWC